MYRNKLLRDFRLENRVALAVDEAILRWQAAERAWLATEFVITNDPDIGTPLSETGNVRSFVFHGAKSIQMPDISVIYEVSLELIIVQDAKFEDAKASTHGNG